MATKEKEKEKIPVKKKEFLSKVTDIMASCKTSSKGGSLKKK